MANIALLFTTGTEECEALNVADILRRAGENVNIISASGDKTVTGSHNITIIADEIIEEHSFENDDVLIIPGGMPGTNNLEASELVQKAIDLLVSKDKLVCAICAAPKVLGHKGLLVGRKAGIYPGMDEELTGANVSYDEVSVDGNFITSRGLGTAIPFGLEILAKLQGREAAEAMASKIVFRV